MAIETRDMTTVIIIKEEIIDVGMLTGATNTTIKIGTIGGIEGETTAYREVAEETTTIGSTIVTGISRGDIMMKGDKMGTEIVVIEIIITSIVEEIK